MNDKLISIDGKISFSTELGNCNIEIHGPDECKPSFHIKNEQYDINISLLESSYIDESSYKLNEIEKQELMSYLCGSETNSNGFSINLCDMSVWNSLIISWFLSNDNDNNFPDNNDNYIMPDYRRL